MAQVICDAYCLEKDGHHAKGLLVRRLPHNTCNEISPFNTGVRRRYTIDKMKIRPVTIYSPNLLRVKVATRRLPQENQCVIRRPGKKPARNSRCMVWISRDEGPQVR